MAMRMRRDRPDPDYPHKRMPDEPARLPDAPGDYGAGGRSPWLDVDWREHQRWVTVDGRQVNVVELGSGPPIVFIHGLSGSWQNWLEQLPVFAREHRVIALRPARASASRRCPRRRSRSPATGASSTRCSTSSASARRRGRQLDGRVHRRRAGDPLPRSASSGSCSCSAAGLSIEYLRNERALGAARAARATAWRLHRLAGLALGRRSRAARGCAAG